MTDDITEKILNEIREKTDYPFIPMTDFDQNLKRQLEPNELLFNPTVYCDDKMQGIGIGKDFYDINMIEELKFLGQNSPLYRHFLRDILEKQLDCYQLACQWIALFEDLIWKYSISRTGVFTYYSGSPDGETVIPKLKREKKSLLQFVPEDLLYLGINHLIYFEK